MKQKLYLSQLVSKFREAVNNGQLDNTSEETMRGWINELLSLFGWDVKNTKQVHQERTLSKEQRELLGEIGSHNIRPDYTLVNGSVKLAFVDAKDLDVDIHTNKSAAFQIRSYGWSIGAKFSILTNFREFAIYDCTARPNIEDTASFARTFYFTYDEYEDNYDTIRRFLDRDCVVTGDFPQANVKVESLDEAFANMLCDFRILLATAIKDKLHSYVSMSAISLWSQIIINRILFIRVCESRKLEEDGLLLSFENSGDFWSVFKKCSYFDFYEHYDGPLFQRLSQINSLDIDNSVFSQLLKHLYYPSPYRFDVIPTKTLSDIYDLFLGYELKISNGKVKNVLRAEFKKSNGAVTTPESIVDNVISRTFENRIEDLNSHALLSLRIVDPACGSGVFLIGAYNYLSFAYMSKACNGDIEFQNDFIIKNGNPILTIQGKKRIINNCLYGVDINPEAVEVAKMSLSLRIIDNYMTSVYEEVGLHGVFILKDVGNNIKCGNSLVGLDVLEEYPTLKENISELRQTRPFSWADNFKNIFSEGGFDYVIGNPPYVEVKNYNLELPTMALYIKKKYLSSRNGKIDLAIPFIEKGIQLLKNTGRLGYIVQKRFFKTDYGKGIRRLLTLENLLHSIYDYAETNLFDGRITYVAVLVCDKNKVNNEYVSYHNSIQSISTSFSAGIFTAMPWSFEDARLNTIRLSLAQRCPTIKDICNVKVGIQVLFDEAYHVLVDSIQDGIIYGHTAMDKEVKIEVDACRPLVCNEHFVSLSTLTYSTFAIFPYDVNGTNVSPILFNDFKERYPLAGDYLLRHKNEIISKVEILPLRNSSYSEVDGWHLYTRANNHNATYKKICIPMTALRPQACVIKDENVYCDNANMFFIQMPDATENELYTLSAVICSDVFMLLAKSIANPQSGGYMKFNKQFLDPIPVPNLESGCDGLADIARHIESINNQIALSGGMDDQSLLIARNQLYVDLNRIVMRMYAFTPDEQQVINALLSDPM